MVSKMFHIARMIVLASFALSSAANFPQADLSLPIHVSQSG
jgi:hypothetical protein